MLRRVLTLHSPSLPHRTPRRHTPGPQRLMIDQYADYGLPSAGVPKAAIKAFFKYCECAGVSRLAPRGANSGQCRRGTLWSRSAP